MKAFILAAGRGERMLPLTKTCPKPLLKVNGRSLIAHQLSKLKLAGIDEVIINIAYLGHMIEDQLGDGSMLGVNVRYSREPEPLETGGAIAHALPSLGEAPFLLVNGDVWMDLDYDDFIARFHARGNDCLGYLAFVPNPSFHSKGDFGLSDTGLVLDRGRDGGDACKSLAFTFSGVSIVDPKLVANFPNKRRIFPLREAFTWAIEHKLLRAEVYDGVWLDVGTPARLRELEQRLRQ